MRHREATLSLLAYVDPPSQNAMVTLTVTVEPGDVCKERASVTLYPEGVKPHKWTRVEIELAEVFPQFVGDTILAVFVRATSDKKDRESEWAFALDDIRVD